VIYMVDTISLEMGETAEEPEYRGSGGSLSICGINVAVDLRVWC